MQPQQQHRAQLGSTPIPRVIESMRGGAGEAVLFDFRPLYLREPCIRYSALGAAEVAGEVGSVPVRLRPPHEGVDVRPTPRAPRGALLATVDNWDG